ncbi:hypothetical protein B1748_04890 [Paenibacillus sp. MY03]|uniref:S-layer homology domain-containing protein n=1 Tax=Paenibacillus sp. MY03 TaxID=302980 RepID=UPI000B3D0B5D|nr:S-layer homology domain-containing protein [Paenibacillus sp. MY03]OUS78104.1 hypothetical protein B1748_04890 [Paenibacillus sp. MY03]
MRKKMMPKLAKLMVAAVLLPIFGTTYYEPAVSAAPIVANTNWRPIDTTMAVAPGSAMDLSFLNPEPAGTHGFVKIDADGDYYFENDPGRKVKFYGGNLNGSYSVDPTKEEMVIMADRIAAMGYNVIRYSSVDQNQEWARGLMNPLTSTTVTLNANKLDNFDYFNALLKSRGVYIDIDIMAFADFRNIPSLGESEYGSTSSSFLATLLPEGQEIWRSFAEQLFNHVNPYTGLALKDDPQFMGVSPINEVILFNGNYSNPNFKAWVIADFNNFLDSKGKPVITTFPNNFWEAPSTIKDDLAEYFTEKQFATYGEMKSYLKDTIGVKAPIGGINYINDSLANYYRTLADIHETHLYNGLVDGRGASFEYNPFTHPRYSMIFAPESSENYVSQHGSFIFKNYIPGLSLGQLHNKPFALTEFNHEFPSKGRDDIGLMTAAAGAYQGWDMLNRFHYVTQVREAIIETPLGGVTSFDTLTDVLGTMSEYQGTLVFRQAHLTPADAKFVIVRDKTYVKTHASATESEYPERNRMYIPHLFKMVTVYADKPGEPYAIYKITPDLTDEQIARGDLPAANKITITESMSLKEVAETFINAIDDDGLKTSMLADLNNNKLVSDTGELLFDLNLNTYFINTPYVVAAAGTLNDNSYELGPVTMSANMPKGTLSAASLDNEPLDESERMLIIYTTDAAATGEYEETVDGKTYYHRGTLPTLAKYGTADIKLKTTRTPGAYKAYKLALNGVRLQEIPVSVTGNDITVQLDTDKGFSFELVYNDIEDHSAPTIPMNLTATALSSYEIALSWDASSDETGVSGYKIYRNGQEIATVNGDVLNFKDTGLTLGTTYRYTVKASDPGNRLSDASNEAVGTTNSVLMSENFDDGHANDWAVNHGWGTFSVVTDGETKVYMSESADKGGVKSLVGSDNWSNYSVEAEVKVDTWNGRIGLLARFVDNGNYYAMKHDNKKVYIVKLENNEETILASSSEMTALSEESYHAFRFEVNGNSLQSYVNGELLASATDSSFHAGKLGVYTHFQKAYFDNVVVTQLLPEPGGNDPLIPTLIEPSISSLALNKGQSHTVTATIYDQYNEPMTGIHLNWSSDHSSIATIDDNGKITGVNKGVTVIRAVYEDLSTDISLSVTDPIPSNGSGNGSADAVVFPSTDKENQLELTAEQLEQAISGASPNTDGYRTIHFEIKPQEGVRSSVLRIPATYLTKHDKLRIELSTPFGQLILPGNIFTSRQAGAGAKEIIITIGEGDLTGASAGMKALAGNRPVIELTASVDGVPVEWSNDHSPVMIRIPYQPSEVESAHLERLTIWHLADDGAIQPIVSGRYDAASESIMFTTRHFSRYAVVSVTKTFGDLVRFDWARQAIETLASKGAIQGISANSFAPGREITRADAIILIMRLLDLSAQPSAASFADVPGGVYYEEAVHTARALGIVFGRGDNRFDPQAHVSRQELMTMIDKAMSVASLKVKKTETASLSQFHDASQLAAYAQNSVLRLLEAGIFQGYNGQLHPASAVTRAETAVALYRLYQLFQLV